MASEQLSERRPHVAVIGGGIIGLSVAWECSRQGARVELFERGAAAGEATRIAAGMLAPVSENDPAEPELLALGLESIAAWPAFAETLERAVGQAASVSAATAHGTPLDSADAPLAGVENPSLVRTDGTLLVARDADEGRWLDREAALLDQAGLAYDRLTPSQARKLEPDLAPGLRGALLVPGDLSVDPRAVAAALQAAFVDHGGALHEHTELAGLDDPRLDGFDRVVVCSGAWPVPGIEPVAQTHPVKGQLLMLRDPDHASREEPIVQRTLRGYNVYVVPRGDGRYAIGATMEHRGYDRTVTAWAMHDLLRELFEVVPAAREFVIDETLAGLRPATASGDPLIGPAPGDPAGDDARVLYAVGHYRNGVLLAPATAARIAALVAY
ncbi:MAG: FAD-dependent oxidoreductase [Solirubrobacteraceae bacterium]|nr:FAD-dependent oxidoreductase [Solirubrobacteraceae bacterium]